MHDRAGAQRATGTLASRGPDAAAAVAVAATTVGVLAVACAVEATFDAIEGGAPPLWTSVAIAVALTSLLAWRGTKAKSQVAVIAAAAGTGALLGALRGIGSVVRVPPDASAAISPSALVPVFGLAGLLGAAAGLPIGLGCARVIRACVEARIRRLPADVETVLWSAGVWLALIALFCLWPLAGPWRVVTAITAISSAAALGGAVRMERSRLAWIESVRAGQIGRFRLSPADDHLGHEAPRSSFFASAPLSDGPDDEVLLELAANDVDYRASANARAVAAIPGDAGRRVEVRGRRALGLIVAAQIAVALAFAFPRFGENLLRFRPAGGLGYEGRAGSSGACEHGDHGVTRK